MLRETDVRELEDILTEVYENPNPVALVGNDVAGMSVAKIIDVMTIAEVETYIGSDTTWAKYIAAFGGQYEQRNDRFKLFGDMGEVREFVTLNYDDPNAYFADDED